MSQPCNRVGLAGTRRMFDQIIEPCTVECRICQQPPHCIALMIAWKNQLLLDRLFSCSLVYYLLTLDKDELSNQFNQTVFAQNIVPHIVHGIIVYAIFQGIACASRNTLATSTVKRNKSSTQPVQLCSHIAGIKVHGKIDQDTRLK